MTRRFFTTMTAAGALGALLAFSGGASAQTGMGFEMGTYPTPLPANNQGPGAMVVAPGLRGPGATYSYVQQPGPAGYSPNAYYSQNFFTRTPMTSPTNGYAPAYPSRYSSGYSGTGYAGGYGYTNAPATGYYAAPSAPTYNTYSNANASYYQSRRGGPIRRMFGR